MKIEEVWAQGGHLRALVLHAPANPTRVKRKEAVTKKPTTKTMRTHMIDTSKEACIREC